MWFTLGLHSYIGTIKVGTLGAYMSIKALMLYCAQELGFLNYFALGPLAQIEVQGLCAAICCVEL